MNDQFNVSLQQFRDGVVTKFQLYNSLFTSLPFHRIEKTGILLSLLFNNCEEGYAKKLSPAEIIEDFFGKHTSYKSESEKNDLLFRFVQYMERQVVLFDALEDAAFKNVHDMHGIGTLKYLESEVLENRKEKELIEKLKDFSIRLVLTAHPTQFYPGSVLGIINDLSKALAENNTSQVNTYLQQLGKTPFFKKKMPTPFDEAVSLIWYLENVFYFKQRLQDLLLMKICFKAWNKQVFIQFIFQFAQQHIHPFKSQSSFQSSYFEIITFDDSSTQCFCDLQCSVTCYKWIAVSVSARPETHSDNGIMLTDRIGKLALH